MGFILIIFIVFVGGGWFIGKIVGDTFISDTDNIVTTKEPPTIINNYTTNVQQNLHISDEAFKSLKEN